MGQTLPKRFFHSRGVPAPNSWRWIRLQIERAHVDQLPFPNVFLSAQMAAPHRARLVAVREAALH